MMPSFGKTSTERLSTCVPALQVVFNEVVKHFDCSIIEGHRGKEAQDKAVANGCSKLKWPNSRHNGWPSGAVDAAPYPISWPNPEDETFHKDLARWYYFAGFVLGVAEGMGIKLRWGGDWDSDRDIKDQNFDDLPHFEVIR